MTDHLLKLDFLEWTEATSSGLHVQSSFTVVPQTVITYAVGERGELFVGNVLEDVSATTIAGITDDGHQRLDFGYARDDASHCYEATQIVSSDITNSEWWIRAERTEEQLADTDNERKQEAVERFLTIFLKEI